MSDHEGSVASAAAAAPVIDDDEQQSEQGVTTKVEEPVAAKEMANETTETDETTETQESTRTEDTTQTEETIRAGEATGSEERTNNDGAGQRYDSDKDSDNLSDLDDDQFEDYDPEAAGVQIYHPDDFRPIDIDEDVAKTLKANKRKRAESDAPKKPKEGRREKKRRSRDSDDSDVDDDFQQSKRPRKTRAGGSAAGAKKSKQKRAAPAPEVVEEELTEAQKIRRAIDDAVAAVLRPPNRRRKKRSDEDLEHEADELIAKLKVDMEIACQQDNIDHAEGKPACQKIMLLPRVLALLNRQNIQADVLDPETNFFEALRFFLEPLEDGVLPAFDIQRKLTEKMLELPIRKETLISSGMGKLMVFYTRSKRVEPVIKRNARHLVAEWTRPCIKYSEEYKERRAEMIRKQDEEAAVRRAEAEKTERELAKIVPNLGPRDWNIRPKSYTIPPPSTFDPVKAAQAAASARLHASGLERFRRLTQKKK